MISVLMPSYGRPEKCKRARQSVLDTAKGNVEVLIYVDEDDPLKSQYKNYFTGPPMQSGKAIKYLVSLSNQMFPKSIMFMGADDMIWETQDWDELVEQRMASHNLSVIYPCDTILKGNKGFAPFFTQRFVEVTGLFPDSFRHFGPDTWVIDIARMAGTLVWAKDVLIRHARDKYDITGNRERKLDPKERAEKIVREGEEERRKLAAKIKALI